MVELATRRVPKTPAADWLKTLPPAARFIFHGGAAARAAAAPAWGPGFSEEACRANAHAERATLWLGPDEYLLLDTAAGLPRAGDALATGTPNSSTPGSGAAAGEETAAATFDAIERAVGDIPHALVDISHRQFAVEVVGPHAAVILSGACPLDLDLTEFPVDMCTSRCGVPSPAMSRACSARSPQSSTQLGSANA
jgi:sarcosine oxidase subunit gamma